MRGEGLVHALVEALVEAVAGHAADFEDVGRLVAEPLGDEVQLGLGVGIEIVVDHIGAGLGDAAGEGDHGDAGVAGLLDGAVERGIGAGQDDDRVVALQDQVLDLRGLLGDGIVGGDHGSAGDRACRPWPCRGYPRSS